MKPIVYNIYLVFKRYTPKENSELKNSIQTFIVSYQIQIRIRTWTW